MATPLLHSKITFIFIHIEALLFEPPSSFPVTLFSDLFLPTKKKLMAESVISGLVQTIIENLGSQILQEIGKIRDFKKELTNSTKQFLESKLY